MARALLSKPKTLMAFASRTFTSSPLPSLSRGEAPALLRRFRPISSAFLFPTVGRSALRAFSTRATSSSLNDPNPNWSNRPPKETILLDGCDFEHWLVVVEKPDENWTRDEIIDHYIKILARIVGSEEEARMKIYSVSTKHYFAFGALVSEELSYKLKEFPEVRWVLPDSYLDVRNKDYGGEPFINGQAVPYDPKYHEEWVRNNARANERNRRNDRPRNNDRSRNFDRRRENMQRRDFQNTSPPPYQPSQQAAPNNMGGGGGMQQMPPQNMGVGGGMQQMQPQNMGGGGGMQQMPPQNMGGGGMQQMPPQHMGGGGGMHQMPPQNMGGGGGMQQMLTPHIGGGGGMPPRMPPPQHNMGPPPNMGGMPPHNPGGMQQNPPPNTGMPPNQGWSNMPPPQQNYNSFSNQTPPQNPQHQNYGGNVPGGNTQFNQN